MRVVLISLLILQLRLLMEIKYWRSSHSCLVSPFLDVLLGIILLCKYLK